MSARDIAARRAAYRTEPASLESGFHKLRRVVRYLDYAHESALDGYTPSELVRIAEAIWAEAFDMWPDELDDDERDYAATHGRLPRRAVRRLKRLWG